MITIERAKIEKYMLKVMEGVRVLDKFKPDWRGAITIDILDLSIGTKCIVGQIFGSFLDGMKYLYKADYRDDQISIDSLIHYAHAHGFDTINDPKEYKNLTDTWIEYLTRERVNDQ